MPIQVTRHSGLQFTVDGVEYIGLNFIEHVDGRGSIWEAIPKVHNLEISPVTPVIVIADGEVVPLTLD